MYTNFLQREDIIENHTRRKKQLSKLLEDTKAALADHESGERRLDEEEHAKHKKRVDLYKRKLDTMPDELDDRVSFGNDIGCFGFDQNDISFI